MKQGDKIEIIKVTNIDSHYDDRKNIEGRTGTILSDLHEWGEGDIALDAEMTETKLIAPAGYEIKAVFAREEEK